ncbi:DUF4352 domain-containing protein [Lactobacillus sp. ESL0233]|uniref:DUF4352 domain-containing protein n=1 Tax=Lactobacillus sp. ESL0233 TaxID=2069354 RepID=UPI000EFDA961|nr:DUF4352 domain-containing protein [Lactobacillus sp. ESL0233]RMC41850.1 DUF4352 domain-containing protein [Lactobacillus sp. ESL0233]
MNKKTNKKLLAITITALAAITLSACGGAENDGQGGAKVSRTAKKKSAPKIKFYKVGDTVKVGQAEYTLKSVVTTNERNEFEDSKPNNVIKITYHVKNDGKDDLSVGDDLEVYGPDDEKLKDYPISDDGLDSIAPGKSTDIMTGYGSKKLGSFELHFKPGDDYDATAAKFKVTVKQ